MRAVRVIPAALLMTVLAGVSSARQDSGVAGGKKETSVQPAQAASDDEQHEFEKIGTEADVAAKLSLINAFAQQHPQSPLLAAVYQQAAYLARQANDISMMTEYAGKSLALSGDNFVLMTDLSDAYVRRNMPDEAEPIAIRALALIGTADKPADISQEQFDKGRQMLTATNLATLGFVHLRRAQKLTDTEQRRAEAAKSVTPFRKALDIQSADDYALYGLGLTYGLLNQYADAESTLARAVASGGPFSVSARPILEDVYRSKHSSLDGLDRIIARARTELGASQGVR